MPLGFFGQDKVKVCANRHDRGYDSQRHGVFGTHRNNNQAGLMHVQEYVLLLDCIYFTHATHATRVGKDGNILGIPCNSLHDIVARGDVPFAWLGGRMYWHAWRDRDTGKNVVEIRRGRVFVPSHTRAFPLLAIVLVRF